MKYRYRDPSEMKCSGVEWLGMIPKEWKISRINQHFIIKTEKVNDIEYPPLSVSKNGIVPQMENVAKTDNNENRKKVCINDFVINSRADRKGSCGISKLEGSVSLISHVLKPLNSIFPNYIHYLFRNYYFSEEFFRWGTGIVADLWSTNIERMKKINIPIFILEEQRKIADFLDKKCVEFDLVIAKKENLIEKLEEAKKSLINEVVTGKVKILENADGNYEVIKRESHEMKESGVEWLGMIPREWEISKLKYLAYINPSNIKKISLDTEVSFIPMESVKNGEIKLEYKKRYEEVLTGYTYFENGDIILAKVTPCFENRNIGICKNLLNGVGFGSTELNTIRVKNKKDLKLLYYFFQDENFIKKGTSTMTGTGGLKRISTDFLKNCPVPIMEEKEKLEINSFLVAKLLNINSVIYKEKQLIEKLKSAKQSLIAEAVTGKIEIL